MKNQIYILVATLFFLGMAQFDLGAMEQGDPDGGTPPAKSLVDAKGKRKLTDEELKILAERAAKKEAERVAKKDESVDETLDESDPCFVANIPAYVPSDSETDNSDSEEYDKSYEFSKEEFDTSPPFKINYEKRGTVLPPLIIDHKKYDSTSGDPVAPGMVEDLCQKMRKTGFDSADQGSKEEQSKHLSMVIGLNRPRSLSSGKNKVLKRELEKPVDKSLPVEYFGMFWDFPWERTEKAKNKSKGNYPSYEEVRSFYKQQKKINPKKAREFRRKNENDEEENRRRMVPYRTLRETVKNNEATLEFIENFRQTNPKNPIYLFFCDSDTVSFNGCLTTFTQIAKEASHKSDAMTTGYLFADDEELNPMIKFASELDMCVREATAKHIPLGVYYPEPALCIMVPENQEMVVERFEDGKADYEAPQESPIILKQVQTRTNAQFAFVYKNPIIIKAPERATTNKQKTKDGTKNKLQFCARFNQSTKKFLLWSMNDLKTITEKSAQSHARPINWAHNVLDAFGSCGGVKKIEILLNNNESIKKDGTALGAVKRNILISLLTRLFKSYNPISLANENRTTFIEVLKNYDQRIQSDVIPVQKNQKVKKPTDLWEKIDGITSRTLLKEVIAQLLPKKEDADLVDVAAREAGKAMKDLLLKYLSLI